MLVDPNFASSHPLANVLGSSRERLQQGLYLVNNWNFECQLGLTQGDMDRNYPKFPDYNPPPYGVCDSPEQFMKRYGDALRNDPRHLVVSFVRLDKKNEEEGGWRWHKWGEYVGEQEPTTEYLYDEPVIETVYTFHIYSLPKHLCTPESLESQAELAKTP